MSSSSINNSAGDTRPNDEREDGADPDMDEANTKSNKLLSINTFEANNIIQCGSITGLQTPTKQFKREQDLKNSKPRANTMDRGRSILSTHSDLSLTPEDKDVDNSPEDNKEEGKLESNVSNASIKDSTAPATAEKNKILKVGSGDSSSSSSTPNTPGKLHYRNSMTSLNSMSSQSSLKYVYMII